MSAPYPNALVLAHPQLSHAQAIEICRREGLRIVQTQRGNFIYEPAAPRFPDSSGRASSPVSLVADAAGHEPEAA